MQDPRLRQADVLTYEIQEINGLDNRATIEQFNSLSSIFPPLELRHLINGYWWLAFKGDQPVGFAGMVPFGFDGYGYCKRCLVKPGHYGYDLQYRFLLERIKRAKETGWTHLVSECLGINSHSAHNFRRAGFEEFEPEQPWAKDSIYFKKAL